MRRPRSPIADIMRGMITRVEAYNYRCFDKLSVELSPLTLLVGPNGAGKTTLLDIPRLLGDMIRGGRGGVSNAFFSDFEGKRAPRARDAREITHCHRGEEFTLLIEAELPEEIQEKLLSRLDKEQRDKPEHRFTSVRYEIALTSSKDGEMFIDGEFVILMSQHLRKFIENGEDYYPYQIILNRNTGEADLLGYFPEDKLSEEVNNSNSNVIRWFTGFETGVDDDLLILSVLPPDSQKFSVLEYLRDLLTTDFLFYEPVTRLLQQPCPPAREHRLEASGRTLPWLAYRLREQNPKRFAAWVAHVRTALADVADVQPVRREDDPRLVAWRESGSPLDLEYLFATGVLS
jgi:energy-coupling factor transporter ATP-binding protein EcfA2